MKGKPVLRQASLKSMMAAAIFLAGCGELRTISAPNALARPPPRAAFAPAFTANTLYVQTVGGSHRFQMPGIVAFSVAQQATSYAVTSTHESESASV
jgi:hypothetical protein